MYVASWIMLLLGGACIVAAIFLRKLEHVTRAGLALIGAILCAFVIIIGFIPPIK